MSDNGCVLPIPGDFDRDGDVDAADLLGFIACGTGPAGAAPLEPSCAGADFDLDQDVDQSDFGVFQRCMTGEDVPGRIDCGA